MMTTKSSVYVKLLATSIHWRHASITVNEQLDLSELEEAAKHVLLLQHTLHIMATLTITMFAKARTSCIAEVLSKTLHIILAFLALCDNELDVLSQVEIDICALRPEHHPHLPIYPKKNRSIDSLSSDFAYRMT